ncbi:MAG: FAD-dependent oxidoreductase [Armatimonadota bacterium]
MRAKYDVVVAGGGMAGIAAAHGAATAGASTLLIERYGFLGGMATAGLVNPFMSYFTSTGKPLVGGFFAELCERMSRMDGMLDRAFDPEVLKYIAQEMVLESGAELLLHACVTGVKLSGERISGLEVMTRSGCVEVDAQYVIDATGDGDVSVMAGVPYERGDQAMTLMFIVGGVDVRESLLFAMKNPDQMRFPKPASEAEIDSMLDGAVGIAGFYEQVDRARESGGFSLPQDMVFFVTLPRPGEVVVNTTHVGGLDATDFADLTKAEVEGRRQAVELMRFLRRYVPGFTKAYILETASQVGVRESRRVKGGYLFSEDDVVGGRKFPDAVLRSAYPVDIHPAGKGYSRSEDRLPPVGPPPGDWYEVPYRCLVPTVIDNLLVAGRCISSTHAGHGAVRIMPNCAALGQAAGVAGALCARKGVSTGNLDTALLRRELLDRGAII